MSVSEYPLCYFSLIRSYRDSLKDAQSKVLRSTSFRRRDLSSLISPPSPTASPPVSSSSSPQHPSVPAKQQSQEKKGPKTMPKPQGILITPQSPPPFTSPHTPKERHVVSPDIRGPSPPALPSVPPVGPPALIRICGRKRLAADQKKRSYSEPENLNEVGVVDAETAPLFRRGGGEQNLSKYLPYISNNQVSMINVTTVLWSNLLVLHRGSWMHTQTLKTKQKKSNKCWH